MIDASWSMAFSLMLGSLFAFSAWEKFTNKLEFSAVVATYKILPVQWCYVAGLVVIALEALAAVLTLLQITLGLWVIMGLLMAYATAIGINLWRGRVHIDCGCGGAPIHLTPWLLVRNAVLVVMAVLAIQPHARSLAAVDWFFSVLAAIALLLLYISVNQLLANRSYWRMQNGVNE